MESGNPIFGYALLPVVDHAILLLVPLSDSLKVIINGLHTAIILQSAQANEVASLETEYGGCIAINTNKVAIDSVFLPTEKVVLNANQPSMTHEVALVGNVRDYHQAIMKSCNKEGNCKVQYSKNGTIVFVFEDLEAQVRKTFLLTLKDFNAIVNTAYTHYITTR